MISQNGDVTTILPAGEARVEPLQHGEVSRIDSVMLELYHHGSSVCAAKVELELAEKGIEIDIINVVPGRYPEDLLDLNPYHSLPTLVDRDLVLYDSRVIMEYLDERFPHPPLMPVDPILRAQFRLALYRIERDWYGLAQQIDEDHDKKHVAKNRKLLREALSSTQQHVRTLAGGMTMPTTYATEGVVPTTPSGSRGVLVNRTV